MNKTLLAIVLCLSPALVLAAQTPVTNVGAFANPATTSINTLKTATNTKLDVIEANRLDHETRVSAMETDKAAVSCFADSTAFNTCFALNWPTGFDTAGDYTVTGSWDFTGATITGLDITLPPATEGQILQADSSGVFQSVSEIAGFLNDDCMAAGDCGLDDALPASQVVTALAGKQAALVSATNIKTVNSVSLLGSGNIDIVGTFGFDTYPIYEDSPHDSGIAVNETTLAVYSPTASKWMTVGLTDTLDPAPVTYALTLTITGASGSDSVLVAGAPYATSSTISGLSSATTTLVGSPDTGREVDCTGTAVGGTAPNYTIDMSDSPEDATCAFSATTAECSPTPFYSNIDNDYNTQTLQSNANTILSGARWVEATPSASICSVEWLLSRVGDVGAYTYELRLYTGGNGTTSLGTYSRTLSTVSGSIFTTTPTFHNFVFDSSAVLNQNDALVLVRSDQTYSGTAFLKMGTQYAANTGSLRPVTSDLNGTTLYSAGTHPVNIKLYSPN